MSVHMHWGLRQSAWNIPDTPEEHLIFYFILLFKGGRLFGSAFDCVFLMPLEVNLCVCLYTECVIHLILH